MNKYDRLKLVAPIESISVIDNKRYQENYRDGILYSRIFMQTYPYKLSIELNFEKSEAIIEFSGKVLGKRYPELISVETINDCFQHINEVGICNIDVKAMMEADVVSCDVTQDILLPNYQETLKMINANIRNRQAYTCRFLRTGSLSIEKNVVTSKYKKRLSIYNKEKEMSNVKNREFISSNDLSGKFDNKCRFELNLKCKEQIRETLHIKDTKLSSVLTSSANPISEFINEILTDDPEGRPSAQGWKEYWQSLVLRDCGYDLEKVEVKLRQYKNPRSCSISKAMTPYRELSSAYNEEASTSSKSKLLRLLNVSN